MLTDPVILDLAARVRIAVDADMEYNFEHAPQMKYESRVHLFMNDGEDVVSYKDIWPETSDMSYDQVARKFRACVAGAMPEARAKAIVDSVRDLEHAPDMGALIAQARSE